MDFNILRENFQVIVMVGCLVIGYILKSFADFIPNKFIPTILAVVGAVINCFSVGIGLESIIYGALMGLASTGMHQAFTQFIKGGEKNG